ncbi:helix-turn-helix domain-containing protein, partial [Verminephrobacter aporrectodeae]|uniref:helix-turn-helix domain-containing protein n=1 Tax=Verminephrobacter aporrectodeae TaxID=1110389 RepID=UPI002ADDB7A5
LMTRGVAMRQTELHLTNKDRKTVGKMRSKGLHHSREVNRAHVLWCLDQNVPESQIMAVLGIGRTTVWRTRLAYLEGGLKLALFDLKRSGGPCKYDTDDEARVVALACSAPPSGRNRWTLMELEHAIRQEPGLSCMGRDTVRRILKKTT